MDSSASGNRGQAFLGTLGNNAPVHNEGGPTTPQVLDRWLFATYSGCYTHYRGVTTPLMVDTVRLFQSADVLEVTGLTRSQLREWTGRGRRELLSPDVGPGGPGRHALFSWQTLLVLRLLLVLHSEFAAEVGAWAPAAKDLRDKLNSTSFPSLWHLSVFFPNRHTALLVDDVSKIGHSGLILPLEPHLTVISSKLSPPPPDQLSLFLPMAVSP